MPLLIAAASLAGRRWGQGVSGWLVGLPLTSGPIAFFLALDHGVTFGAAAAMGSLVGATAEAAFCLVYGRAAFRWRWPVALAGGCVAFATVAVTLQRLALPWIGLALGVFAALAAALRFMPTGSEASVSEPPPRWDLPARMVIATVLVLLITGVAPALGPQLSGALAAFPVYAATLTVFAHRSGAAPAVEVLRGLLLGLFAFAGFFLVLGGLIERVGVTAGFAAAIVTALAIQAVSFSLALASGEGTIRPRPPA